MAEEVAATVPTWLVAEAAGIAPKVDAPKSSAVNPAPILRLLRVLLVVVRAAALVAVLRGIAI
ncbi:hypothetical protein ACU21_04525 [Actinobaculum suis]|nr:hypothetical protein ACU21_04525 [Actinobaculum suis]